MAVPPINYSRILLWSIDNLKYIIMATYAKILKDTEDNQILPYTRSKLVYMDDGSTVEEAVTRPATNAQLGRVIIGNGLGYDDKGTISLGKVGITSTLGYVPVSPDDYGSKNAHGILQVGSNINVDNGVISINDANIKEALGYMPSNMTPEYYEWNLNNVGTFINNSKFSINNASTIYTSFNMYITMYSRQIAFCTFYGYLKNDAAAFTNTAGHGLILNFSSHGSGSMRKQFPISIYASGFPKQVGFMIIQCNSGGSYMTINTSFREAVTAGTMIFSTFALCPFQ